MIRDTRETRCPGPSRFWDVALGGSWESAEGHHVASCPQCQAAERTVRSAVADRIPTGIHRQPLSLEETGHGPEIANDLEATVEPERQTLLSELLVLERGLRQGQGERIGQAEDRSRHDAQAAVTPTVGESTSSLALSSTSAEGTQAVAGPDGAWSDLPESLGDYKVIALIGQGGMGRVYKVHDVALDRVAALKIDRHAADGRAIDRFFRAARVVARLKHPSIVQIYHVGQVDGTPYVVSEFIAGGDLSSLAESGTLTWCDMARIVTEVAEALQYVHEQGIIHRDVKPSNIMIRPGCHAALTDFGLARSLGGDDEASITFEGEIFGTPAYMSPEQVEGRIEAICPASDIYSLGATLYVLLTGRRPHQGPRPFEMLRQILQDKPVPPRRLVPAVPSDLEAICLKALRKHPDDRYRSARAMAEDLRRYLDDRPILARPLSWPERLAHWLRHHPGGAVLALLAVATLSLVVFQRFELKQEVRRRLDAEGRHELRLTINQPSEVELRRAVELSRSRIRDHPELRDSRRALAAIYHRLGDLLVNTDRMTDATRAYDEAVALFNQHLHDEVGDAATWVELADVLGNLGEASWSLGRLPAARTAYSKSLNLRRHLVAVYPEVPTYRNELARTLTRLNQLLDAAGGVSEFRDE